MTTLHKEPAGIVAYSKVRPKYPQVMQSTTNQRRRRILDESSVKKHFEVAEAMASDACGFLAVSLKRDATLETAEREMTFLGWSVMIDPPRPEAQAAIRSCEEAGIKVVMITGDHVSTAKAVARELGLFQNWLCSKRSGIETISDGSV